MSDSSPFSIGRTPLSRRKFLRGGLFIERILMQLRDVATQPIELFLLMRRRFVVQLRVVTGDTVLLDQTDSGQELGFVKDEFDEDAFDICIECLDSDLVLVDFATRLPND